jgi:hypothetical protein
MLSFLSKNLERCAGSGASHIPLVKLTISTNNQKSHAA